MELITSVMAACTRGSSRKVIWKGWAKYNGRMGTTTKEVLQIILLMDMENIIQSTAIPTMRVLILMEKDMAKGRFGLIRKCLMGIGSMGSFGLGSLCLMGHEFYVL